jgi:mannose-6-phosphate isomerase-like protein (cupin superfamily)
MNESLFLNGKVVKRSLDVIHGRPGSGAPRLKRLFLAQGELAQVYDGEEGIRYLAFTELRTGGIRGNHYHEAKEEVVYVIAGEIQLVLEDIVTKERASLSVQTGELAIIPVRIAHGFRTVLAGQAIEWSKTRFDAADSFPYPLVE